MVRQKLKESGFGKPAEFNIRGAANTRIEALSDGVFAIAIALLLISSQPPETYDELIAFLSDFVPFAGTIAILMTIWFEHYTFFLRYGLTDATTVSLNSILLFLILFYVYPLKFLFNVLYKLFLALVLGDEVLLKDLFSNYIAIEDTTSLMVIYGIGAACIFLFFVLLYRYALHCAPGLNLSPTEVFETKSKIYINLVAMTVPLISALIALLKLGGDQLAFIISGWTYFLYPILLPMYGTFRNKRKRNLIASLEQNSAD